MKPYPQKPYTQWGQQGQGQYNRPFPLLFDDTLTQLGKMNRLLKLFEMLQENFITMQDYLDEVLQFIEAEYDKNELLFTELKEMVQSYNHRLHHAEENAIQALSLAQSLNNKIEATASRLDTIIIESGTSDAETLASRTNGETGVTHDTLYNRLDSDYRELIDITNTVWANVKLFGAQGDGVNDDIFAIKLAIDYLVQKGGGRLYFPSGTYLISEPIKLVSNIHYYGTDATIKDHILLEANPIFLDDDEIKENVTIEGFTFTNGQATTDYFTIGKNVLRGKHFKNLKVANNFFTEIEGGHCIYVRKSNNVVIENNKFYRWTYSAIFIGAESENIHILRNVMDTPTATTSETHTYCICTGSDHLDAGEFLVKNIWIDGNKCLNNPKWEGIDTHGAENVWITNNYVENCLTGIMCGLPSDRDYVPRQVLTHVVIEGNVIVRDEPNGSYGIILKGKGVTNQADGVIRNNTIKNHGSLTQGSLSPIVVSQTKGVLIERNVIDGFGVAGITVNLECYETIIKHNIIKNSHLVNAPDTNAAINTVANWIWGLTIEDNYAENVTSVVSFYATINRVAGVRLKNNTGKKVKAIYSRLGGVPMYKNTIPTSVNNMLMMAYGDKVYNTDNIPTHIVTFPLSGFGGSGVGEICKATGLGGSKQITVSNFVSPKTYRDLPIGLKIKIEGVGLDGLWFESEIVDYNPTTITLLDELPTTFTNASLHVQTLVLTPLQATATV